MKQKSRFRIARRFLIFWTLFIGVGAVAGALAMLCDPSGKFMGMDAMLPYFQVLPFADRVFQDFTFSGWALLIVNGLTNLTAAGLLLAKKALGYCVGWNIRHHADALDLHPVLHFSAQLHVHKLLSLWRGPGRCRLCRMGVPQAGGIPCSSDGLPQYRHG